MKPRQSHNELNKGIFTYPEIAQILGIPYHKVNRWLKVYWEGKLGERFNRKYAWTVNSTKAVGFHTMVELSIFYQLHDAGIKPKKILEAHLELSKLFDSDYPFANKEVLEGLSCSGKKVFFKNKQGDLLELDGTRQFNIPFVLDLLKKLDFEDQIASKMWPLGKEKSIVCDPKRKMGHPVIASSNVYPEVISNMHRAGDSLKLIAFQFDLTLKEVKDALQFEQAA